MDAILRTVVLCLGLSMMATFAWAQSEALRPVMLTPNEFVWVARGELGSSATIVGDASKAGMYAGILKMTSGLRVQPHSHPDNRVVTILAGTFYIGYGDKFDESKLKALPAGSIYTEPANQPHFAWAKDGEVVFFAVGNGPTATTPVRPTQ